MEYIVRTFDRCFTEAYYESFEDVVKFWSAEILAGTHYFMVTNTMS